MKNLILLSKGKVEFMVAVSWFLGDYCVWHKNKEGCIVYHISWEAFIKNFLKKHSIQNCNAASSSPCYSGLVIDWIPKDGNSPDMKAELGLRNVWFFLWFGYFRTWSWLVHHVLKLSCSLLFEVFIYCFLSCFDYSYIKQLVEGSRHYQNRSLRADINNITE